MVVRMLARPLLAAPFVLLGYDAFRHPEARVDLARPVVEKITETADKQLPVQVPKDVEQWVRIDAGVKVGAGALFALGKFRRLSALALAGSMVPTTLAGHRYWEQEDDAKRHTQRIQFLKNLGLIGAMLLAAVDTEGKPSVGWRARRAAKRAGEVSEKNLAKAQKAAAKAQKQAKKQASDARKQARKQAKKVAS